MKIFIKWKKLLIKNTAPKKNLLNIQLNGKTIATKIQLGNRSKIC